MSQIGLEDCDIDHDWSLPLRPGAAQALLPQHSLRPHPQGWMPLHPWRKAGSPRNMMVRMTVKICAGYFSIYRSMR